MTARSTMMIVVPRALGRNFRSKYLAAIPVLSVNAHDAHEYRSIAQQVQLHKSGLAGAEPSMPFRLDRIRFSTGAADDKMRAVANDVLQRMFMPGDIDISRIPLQQGKNRFAESPVRRMAGVLRVREKFPVKRVK